jgi:cyclase
VLLALDGALVKTVSFRDPLYVGDPVNAVQIFSDLGADELVFLDIGATRAGRGPDLELVAQIASEAFMPLAVGGGISNLEQAAALFKAGIEKVVLNTGASESSGLVSELAKRYGSQAVIGCIDYRWPPGCGPVAYSRSGTRQLDEPLERLALRWESEGAGELLLQSIDRDGTYSGFDLDLLSEISSKVRIPVIACGGAGSVSDLVAGVRKGGASASAAGSLFVFQGRGKGVLINYPAEQELERLFE